MAKDIRAAISRLIYYLGLPIVAVHVRNSYRAYVLVEASGQILLVKDWFGNHKYKLPGGGLKKGDEPKEGALRELYEETRIKLQPDQLSELIKGKQKYPGGSYDYVIFKATLDKQVWPEAGKLEIMEAVWLSPSSINNVNSNPISIKALTAAGFEV